MRPDLGSMLRKRRREKDITQTQLANLVGVSRPVVWAWERGLYRPSGNATIKLLQVLDLQTKDFEIQETNNVQSDNLQLPE